jgi:hypothetical protein
MLAAVLHRGTSSKFCLLQVFTSIFTLECFLKILALSKEYFACGWNIFDLIIVSASLLDLSFELMDSLVVLRCLRLVSGNLYLYCFVSLNKQQRRG